MASRSLSSLVQNTSRQLGGYPKVKRLHYMKFNATSFNCDYHLIHKCNVTGYKNVKNHLLINYDTAIKKTHLHTSLSRYNSEETVNCADCMHSYSSKTTDFVSLVSCPKCGSLQKIDYSRLPNYFEILDQEKGYNVDLQSIANKTKQLQRKFHPDLYSQKSSEQQSLSQEYSSLINKALWTVSDPIARGRYLLNLAGEFPDDPNSDLEKTMTKDPEFLEEVMELNERLEEIGSEDDWKKFRDENEETMQGIYRDLEVAFANEDMKEAQRLLGRLKYYDTLQHKLKELQSRIGVVE